MKKVLLVLVLSFVGVGCGEVRKCNYSVEATRFDATVDTLNFIFYSDNPNLVLLENGTIKAGNNILLTDSVTSYKILLKDCAKVTDSILIR